MTRFHASRETLRCVCLFAGDQKAERGRSKGRPRPFMAVITRPRQHLQFLAIDQGTTSTSTIAFGPDAAPVATAQKE